MIWSKLVWWVTWRGLVSGAILGALFGVFILFIYGAIIGFVLGGIMGSALGFIDGILLTFITGFLYSPPNTKSIYPKVAYTVSILTNTVPFFVILGGLMLSWAVMPLSFGQSITSVICSGGIPALLSGIATAYFCGGYLEYADSLLAQKASPNLPIKPTSLIEKTDAFSWFSPEKPKRYKYLFTLVILVLAVIASIWGIRAPMIQNGRLPDRYLIPEGYKGEVKVYYLVPDAPPLSIEDGHYLLVIPKEGVLKTSSNIDYGVASDDDYYTYRSDGTRSKLLKTAWGGGGMIWGGGVGGDNFGNTYTTLFVGTEDELRQ